MIFEGASVGCVRALISISKNLDCRDVIEESWIFSLEDAQVRILCQIMGVTKMNQATCQGVKFGLNKVPEVTLGFWIIKIMSTTVGETGADYLAVNVGWGPAVTGAIMSALLVAALLVQFRMSRYVPSIYWLTVVLVSVVGTQITDALTDKLDVSLYASTTFFSFALAAIFALWYRTERTLSIRYIITKRRELFYWLAILCAFALGTAAGDLATEALGLGFKVGVVIFGISIAVTTGAYYFGANGALTFWIAYILTRPLGASLGDLLSQSPEYGGMGLGNVKTSIAFLVIIISLVAFLSMSQDRTQYRKVES